jgi:hypothetical protein
MTWQITAKAAGSGRSSKKRADTLKALSNAPIV